MPQPICGAQRQPCGSLLPPCESQGANPGCQTWQQASFSNQCAVSWPSWFGLVVLFCYMVILGDHLGCLLFKALKVIVYI